jgi:general secretion pathway protein B
MSYILDALRRADAERERDPARGIHAQPAAVLPRDARRSRAPWALAGLALVAAAAAAYLLAYREPGRVAAPVERVQPLPAVAQASVPAVVPVATAVLPPPPPMPAPAVQRPAPRPVVAAGDRMVVKDSVTVARLERAPPAPGVTSAPGAAPPPAGVPAAPAAAPPTMAPRAAPATAPSTAPTTGPSTAPSATAPAGSSTPPARIVAVSELPADLQRELPKLVIAGGVYSENAAQRMLIVAGQVRSEGAELAPGLVLEQIRTNSAVLRFKGWRYSVSF